MPETAPVSFDPAQMVVADPGSPEADAPLIPMNCSNLPTGDPYRPDDPTSQVPGTKAEADTSKLWDNGTRLKIHFLNDGDAWGQTVRKAIERIAPVWSDYANLTFDFTSQNTAHIVIQLSPVAGSDGRPVYAFWSVYGKEALSEIGNRRWSMSLAYDPSFARNPQFLESEFLRVIPHEFGHAIGFIHEHIRPDRPIIWDEARVKARFGAAPNNWNDQMIRSNILDFYKPVGGFSDLKGTTFDLKSIMMYSYLPDPDGQPLAHYNDAAHTPFVTQNNYALSPLDKVLANMLYPATGVTDPDEASLTPGGPATSGSISQVGQVARYKFRPRFAQALAITATGPVLVALLATRKDPAGRMLAIDASVTSDLKFNAERAGQDYFIEVRHAQPMKGTGDFTIKVAPLT